MNRSAKKKVDGDPRSRRRIQLEMKGEAFPTSMATWLACMKLIESEAMPDPPLPYTADDIIRYGQKRHCNNSLNNALKGAADER